MMECIRRIIRSTTKNGRMKENERPEKEKNRGRKMEGKAKNDPKEKGKIYLQDKWNYYKDLKKNEKKSDSRRR